MVLITGAQENRDEISEKSQCEQQKSKGDEKYFLEEMKLVIHYFSLKHQTYQFNLVEILEGLQIIIFLSIQKGPLWKKNRLYDEKLIYEQLFLELHFIFSVLYI